MRDAAALGNREVLPWNCWGAMPAPDAAIGEDDSAGPSTERSASNQPGRCGS